MAELLYEPVRTKNEKAVGFIVSWDWHSTFYVPMGCLALGSENILMGGGHCEREMEFASGETFFWGKPSLSIEIRDAKWANIKILETVPDWVGKDLDGVMEDIEAYQAEKYKKSLIGRFFGLFAKKEA